MAFNILDKENKAKLQGIIDELEAKQSLPVGSDAQQIRDFYRSALDTANLKIEGLQTLQPYMDMINDAQSIEDFLKVMNTIVPSGVRTAFGFHVSSSFQLWLCLCR